MNGVVMKIKLVAIAIAAVMLSGCVSIPQSIKGTNSAVKNETYSTMYGDFPFYKGREVRIGGRVTNVINNNKETLFEIVTLPLNDSARPEINRNYQGRVMVKANEFIDPISLRGHFVTVVGTVNSIVEGRVGNFDYNFIRLDLIGYQIWKVRDDIMPIGVMDYGFGPYWQNQWGAAYNTYMPGWGWGWYPDETSYQIQKQVIR